MCQWVTVGTYHIIMPNYTVLAKFRKYSCTTLIVQPRNNFCHDALIIVIKIKICFCLVSIMCSCCPVQSRIVNVVEKKLKSFPTSILRIDIASVSNPLFY